MRAQLKGRISCRGFALLTELITLVIFGFSVLALSSLSGKTVVASSESLQRIHATWLANSLIARLSMNKDAAYELAYQPDNINCDARPTTSRSEADLLAMFCKPVGTLQSKSIQAMGDFTWTLNCAGADSANTPICPEDSLFTLQFFWLTQDATSNVADAAVRYEFYL